MAQESAPLQGASPSPLGVDDAESSAVGKPERKFGAVRAFQSMQVKVGGSLLFRGGLTPELRAKQNPFMK